MANISNVGIGLTSGQPTASGVEFVKDRGVGQTQHYPGKVVLDSLSRDKRRNPTTLLENGLALFINGSGNWQSAANGAQTFKGILDADVYGINLLDQDGVAQHDTQRGRVLIRGLVDPNLVLDENGTAVDATAKTNLSTGSNGCNIMFMAS